MLKKAISNSSVSGLKSESSIYLLNLVLKHATKSYTNTLVARLQGHQKQMTEQELQIYIDNYTSVDFERIKLVWNEKYGHDFEDDNYNFRLQVCEFVIPQIDKVNIGLIRDLYIETAKTSPLTFSVYNKFHLFADELLKRGGTDYLIDYIRGASQSMDTGMSSGRLTISKEQSKNLLEHFDKLKATTKDKEEQRLLNDYIRQRLEYNANK